MGPRDVESGRAVDTLGLPVGEVDLGRAAGALQLLPVDPPADRVVRLEDARELTLLPGELRVGLGAPFLQPDPEFADRLHRSVERHGDLDRTVTVLRHHAVVDHPQWSPVDNAGRVELPRDRRRGGVDELVEAVHVDPAFGGEHLQFGGIAQLYVVHQFLPSGEVAVEIPDELPPDADVPLDTPPPPADRLRQGRAAATHPSHQRAACPRGGVNPPGTGPRSPRRPGTRSAPAAP